MIYSCYTVVYLLITCEAFVNILTSCLMTIYVNDKQMYSSTNIEDKTGSTFSYDILLNEIK